MIPLTRSRTNVKIFEGLAVFNHSTGTELKNDLAIMKLVNSQTNFKPPKQDTLRHVTSERGNINRNARAKETKTRCGDYHDTCFTLSAACVMLVFGAAAESV